MKKILFVQHQLRIHARDADERQLYPAFAKFLVACHGQLAGVVPMATRAVNEVCAAVEEDLPPESRKKLMRLAQTYVARIDAAVRVQ